MGDENNGLLNTENENPSTDNPDLETGEQTPSDNTDKGGKGDQVAPHEVSARKDGWLPKDEYQGDPAKWRGAEAFNLNGKWIKRLNANDRKLAEVESKFDARLDNANKLHKHQMDVQKKDLVRQRDDAIDQGDRKTANAIQDDIDEINKQPDIIDVKTEGTPEAGDLIDNWNKSNTWINGQTAKAGYAKNQFTYHQSLGLDEAASLIAMENDIRNEFPDKNTNRSGQPSSEGGAPPGVTKSKNIGWGDLTTEEASLYQPDVWTKKEYLQAVKDVRNEES